MMHKNRRWCVGQVGSAEELAEKLTGHTWTRCTGFELSGYGPGQKICNTRLADQR
jgi:hypothetical protein